MYCCDCCPLTFSRNDNLKRHKMMQHPPPPPPPPPPHTTLVHLFTLMAVGPTACGKTTWVFQLLERIQMIEPTPRRIMYFYKHWQPLYDEMLQKVPHVEFTRGLPHNVRDDDFFDTRYPTLIVLDDQMRDAVQSGEVCELFTEGSHHRNLSVICLMQNLFHRGKESRTMSLNTSYMARALDFWASEVWYCIGIFLSQGV